MKVPFTGKSSDTENPSPIALAYQLLKTLQAFAKSEVAASLVQTVADANTNRATAAPVVLDQSHPVRRLALRGLRTVGYVLVGAGVGATVATNTKVQQVAAQQYAAAHDKAPDPISRRLPQPAYTGG